MAYRVTSGLNTYLIGAVEAQRFFRQLPLQFQDRVLKAAFREASKPVADDASRRAPMQPATERLKKTRKAKGGVRTVPLKQSIKTVSGGSINRTGALGTTRTGALRRKPYRAFHAQFNEFGTGPRKPGGWYAELIKRSKMTRMWTQPKMPRQPFMEPAIQSKKPMVIKSVQQFVDKKTVALMKRLLKKGLVNIK
jgi:HK97 gp10 family phage protein